MGTTFNAKCPCKTQKTAGEHRGRAGHVKTGKGWSCAARLLGVTLVSLTTVWMSKLE